MANKTALARANDEAKDMRGKVKSDFPKHYLTEALRIAQAIEEKNGGKPMPPTDVAIAIGISPGSSELRTLLSASLKYGLTTGSYKQERIGITPSAASIVSPLSPEAARQALVEAALTPETFRNLYSYFRGKKLPDAVFFENTAVREFDIPREHAAKCVDIFVKNIDFVGLVRTAPTGKWLSTDQVPVVVANEPTETDEEEDSVRDTVSEFAPPMRSTATPSNGISPKPKNAIFLGHGKNKQPLEELKRILDQYKLPYRVATEEANQFRPISDKVADAMHECGAAILIFTADEQLQTLDNRTIWRPSENVVHELGAASILYRGRIIIFKEEKVELPTNFSGIGYISFERDKLSAKALDLFKELVAFGLIKISVGE